MKTYINEHGTEVIDYTDERPVFEPFDFKAAVDKAYEYEETHNAGNHSMLSWEQGLIVGSSITDTTYVYLTRCDCPDELIERHLEYATARIKNAILGVMYSMAERIEISEDRAYAIQLFESRGWLMNLYLYKPKIGGVLYKAAEYVRSNGSPKFRTKLVDIDRKKKKDFNDIVEQLPSVQAVLDSFKGGHTRESA